MITKEQRADLVEALEGKDPVDCDEGLMLQVLRQFDAADKRIAELEKDNGIFQDANIRLTKEFEQALAALGRKNRALKHEIRKLHRAREQDWEAGKRWRKEFIEDHNRLLSEFTLQGVSRTDADNKVAALETRIAELEAAAQWRPMATAPRDGTWILILNRGPVSPEASAIRSKGDGWEGCDGWEYSDQELGIGHPECTTRWLPIPALPKGGV